MINPSGLQETIHLVISEWLQHVIIHDFLSLLWAENGNRHPSSILILPHPISDGHIQGNVHTTDLHTKVPAMV